MERESTYIFCFSPVSDMHRFNFYYEIFLHVIRILKHSKPNKGLNQNATVYQWQQLYVTTTDY